MDLNEFHRNNWERFPPVHSTLELVACVSEEIGELAAAVLGVTGAKKRKANLSKDDVLDAVADAFTYVSLLLYSVGWTNLQSLLLEPIGVSSLNSYHRIFATVGKAESTLMHVAAISVIHGKLAETVLTDNGHVSTYACALIQRLSAMASHYNCANLEKLIGETFNMVSDRCGSSIKVLI